MAKIQDILVKIGANIKDFTRGMKSAENSFEELAKQAQQTTAKTNASFSAMGKSSEEMHKSMKSAFKETRQQLQPFRDELQKAEYGFFEMAKGMHEFEGSTKDLMSQIGALGKAQKTATDNMVKNNNLLKASYLQQAGYFMNASTHAEKLHDIYKQTNPTLAKFTAGTLAAQASMQRFANSGSAAQIALEALGKSANPKQIQDFVRNLNQSLAAVPIVAGAAAIAFIGLTAAIAKAAHGPDPTDVYKKQEQALAEYAQAVEQRTNEIMSAWSLFDKVQLNSPNPNTLIQNLADQVTALQAWRINLGNIAQRAGSEFANYLSSLGPTAAGEVQTIANMTDPELAKYVDLWRQKMIHARKAAITELEKLKEETDKKVKDLQATLTPLGLAAERFKSTWASALKPFVELWGKIFAKIVDAGTAVGKFFEKLNQINPIFSQIIFSILYLFTLFLILAIPIALVGKAMLGLRAIAFAFLKPLAAVGSLLAAASPIALALAAAVVLIAAAFYLLWTRSETFRNAVIAGWEAIKTATIAAWDFILNSVLIPIWNGIVALAMVIFEQLKAFWQENGDSIMQIATAVWSFVSTEIGGFLERIWQVMQFIWNLVSSYVESVWGNIQGIISGAVDVILGIIGLFVSLLTGDWESAWDNVKRIVEGAWELISSAVTIGVDAVLGLIKGLGKSIGGEFEEMANSFYDAGKGFMDMLRQGIEDAVGGVLSAIEWVAGKARDFLPFSPAKDGPLSDLDKLDFGGPIADSITKGVPMIRGLLGDMLALPTIQAGGVEAASAGQGGVVNNFTIGSLVVREEADINKVAQQLYTLQKMSVRRAGL